MSLLSQLKPQKGSKKSMKRLGRGDASGHGGTSTKGHKGQKARSSPHITRGFEGGQMPLHRRSPKWGFTNIARREYVPVNLDTLSRHFQNGEEITLAKMRERNLVKGAKIRVKVLGRGKLDKALKVSAHAFSASAKKSIEDAKGSANLLGTKLAS